MSGKNLLEGRTGPVTQSVDAIKSLLAYVGRASDPMPCDVSLDNGRLVLVLSNKKDAYYTCTATACSCPSAAYRPGQTCKHQRKFFPQVAKVEQSTEPGSIRPVGKWPGGMNGPIDECKYAAQMPHPFSWVDDPDSQADLLYKLARELADVEELECPAY